MTDWIWNEKPSYPGWYAVTICWSIDEGMFPSAAYFDGAQWAKKLPILAHHGNTFPTEREAVTWAYAHDMEAA
jgi:hypothetical protein